MWDRLVFQSQLIVCMHLLSHIANAFNFFYTKCSSQAFFPQQEQRTNTYLGLLCVRVPVCVVAAFFQMHTLLASATASLVIHDELTPL